MYHLRYLQFGQRFKIKNVKLNKASESGVGLFGVNKGVIANVIIDSGEIVGASQVGAIAGSNLGEITGCTNFAFVKGNGVGIGGIAGSNSGNINNCANGTASEIHILQLNILFS